MLTGTPFAGTYSYGTPGFSCGALLSRLRWWAQSTTGTDDALPDAALMSIPVKSPALLNVLIWLLSVSSDGCRRGHRLCFGGSGKWLVRRAGVGM